MLLIGEVARRTGLSASALRYYEKAGLLPAPARTSKQRRYDPGIVGRIRIIVLARDAGFTIKQTRTFLSGFPIGTTPAARWRTLAMQKLEELNAQMNRITQMRAILEASFHCECHRLEDCEQIAARGASNGKPRRRATG